MTEELELGIHIEELETRCVPSVFVYTAGAGSVFIEHAGNPFMGLRVFNVEAGVMVSLV